MTAPYMVDLLCATREWAADVAVGRGADRQMLWAELIFIDQMFLAILSGAADELEFYGGER